MNDLLRNWASLSSEQRELALLLLQEQGVDVDRALILPQDRPNGRAPLSFAQQRLWFLDQLTPGSAMYNIPSAVRLSGHLDAEALHWALNEVVRRHEVLRTIFGVEQDEPVQIILPELTLPMPVVDLAQGNPANGASPTQLLAAATRLAAQEAQHPFDLATGPLLRAKLLRLGDDDHVLLFNMHHIVSDGWSVGVLIAELATLYGAFLEGQVTPWRRAQAASPLPPLPIQYADFAAWQRRVLGGHEGHEDGTSPLQEQLDYWRHQLEGSPPLLELPTDRPRPAIQTSHGAIQPFSLDRVASEALKRLAHSEEATPFMVLLAAFQALLHRHSGQDDICVGTPVANRTRAELEPLIGLFANTLVIRARFKAPERGTVDAVNGAPYGLTFRQLLRQVRMLVIEAQAHQDVQFEMLVEELRPQRDMSYTPLFQAMFSYQQAAKHNVQLPGLTLSSLEAHSGTAKFDLLLNVADMPSGFAGSLEYNTDLFDASTIARLVGHFQILLQGITASPNRPVAQLPLLTPTEQQMILVDWNNTDATIDTESTLDERFSQQAARTPDAIAVIAEAPDGQLSQLSYRDLDQRSNQLAHYLAEIGVSPGDIVGLLTGRSTDTLVGLIGILKAGAAYLPLDSTYPADRLAFMLQDSGAHVLLTSESANRRIGEWAKQQLGEAATLHLDSDWPTISQQPDISPLPTATPDHVAYVIYTSGSTGRPKGVMIPHRNALNLAAALHRVAYAQHPLERPWRISLNAPLAFDASVQQWIMLTRGHTLIIVPPEIRSDAQALLDFIRRHRLDQLDCVPSQLKLLLAAGLLEPAAGWTPSVVFPGGEAIDPATWQALAAAPTIDFFNMYGPTECTVDATTASSRLAPARPTIGRPLINTHVYVLDRHMQPVPIGVPGELFIAGAGVAHGYHNRPALTAERFIPNPFLNAERRGHASEGREQEASATTAIRSIRSQNPLLPLRLYRTGDLVRWLPDGNLEFLGRTDFQVKVRGFRIELGEIEAVLRLHPAIKEAIVLVREDRATQPGEEGWPDDKHLVAYLVAHEGMDMPSAAELRRHLTTDLPNYMIPSAFVALDAMPLTPNAKIDRKALPAPQASLVETGLTYTAPRTPTEEVLAGIWAGLLQVRRIGIHDDFFALGGHSLSATQLIARVRQAFEVELPLRSLFETPTIAGLAELVDRAIQSAAGLEMPPITSLPRSSEGTPTDPPPLSFAQQRLWFLDQFEPGGSAYNIPMAFRLSGKLSSRALKRALDEIVRRHEVLRTAFASQDGRAVQIIAPELELDVPYSDLRPLPESQREAEMQRLVAQEAQRPFDLARGPLLRVRLLRIDDHDQVVVVVMHHIVSDGWSIGVLIREFAALYQAYQQLEETSSEELDAGMKAERLLEVGLTPLPIQYADYAVWQRQWLQGETLQKQLDYWSAQLAGAPSLLELPTDRPRPAIVTYNGAYQTFGLGKELSDALAELSSSQGVTLYMTLLAAFQVLLSRYSGHDDISVGTPIANRTRAELEGLIGFFANTLVMRTRLSPEPAGEGPFSFRTLLRRVRETALGAYAHQDVPFEMLVDKLHPQRDMSHTPLFQVMFTLQNALPEAIALRGLTLSPIDIESQAAKFDLSLTLVEGPDGLQGALEYNTDLFDAATIQRMLGHFQRLLEAIVTDVDQPISLLPLLSAAERGFLLVDWNATGTALPGALAAHQLFEAQAQATPKAIAVRMFSSQRSEGDEERGTPGSLLTYDELDRRANQLARHLQALGVGPDALVGLCIERSLEMVVGILGVLKAGGAYVPIDPTYPAQRIAFMIEDSGIQVLLSSEWVQQRIGEWANQRISDQGLAGAARRESANQRSPIRPFADSQIRRFADSPIRTLLLDSDWPAIAQQPEQAPSVPLHPENLAYVIYTSGSTGRPKGAMIHHLGLVNYLNWCRQAYPLDDGNGAPVHSSISFDLSVTAVLAPLACGRTVQLLPEDLGVEALVAALRHQGDFSLVKITPAHLELLSQQIPGQEAARCTRAFIIGGENLLADTIAFWQDHAPDTALVNEYGPTEAVVGCCVYWAQPDRRELGSVAIGRPIINTQLYVLDQHLNPVPMGVPGELYIAGIPVARGYHGRPGLTAERFVPNPFLNAERGTQNAEASMQDAPTSEEIRSIRSRNPLHRSHNPLHRSHNPLRLYRTGDLVRMRADGQLEFLGRTDHQVKVRGYRIELDEIDAVLGTHPDVEESITLAREDRPGAGTQLVAYVVPANGREMQAPRLRAFLRERLPEYMVPSAFVCLDALPLTPNGKVDRRALPAPGALTRAELASEYLAPSSVVEHILAGIWEHVLGVARVGVHDNFFELGGDSILSIQVIARANQAGLNLTPRQIFQAPTVAGLAVLAGTATVASAEQGLVVGAFPLTPIQHWFLGLDLPNPNHWNQSILLAVREQLAADSLREAVAVLLNHHDALRLRFRLSPNGWEQASAGLEPGDVSAVFSHVDLSDLSESQASAAVESRATEAQEALDILHGPLLRVVYFDFGPQRPGRLLMVAHHLVVDGVSWRILLEDLQTAHEQHRHSGQVRLPAKTTSYGAWAQRLQDYAGSQDLRAELAHWLAPGERWRPLLPLDMPVKPEDITEDSADQVTVTLDEQETKALLRDVPPVYGTEINDILLTALTQAMEQWTGAPDLLIHLEGHGREDIPAPADGEGGGGLDISRTVGWFTTLYPVRLELPANAPPDAAIKAIKEQLRAIPNRGLGYGLLRYLNDDPEIADALAMLPEPAVAFNYLGQFDQALGEGSPLGLARESAGPERSPRGRRTHLLQITGGIVGGQLSMSLTFSRNAHRRATMEALAAAFVQALQGLIAHCQLPDAGGYTPSDFDLAGLDQAKLDKLLKKIRR